MKQEVQRRVAAAARHILKTGATVRACAEIFGVSKTTIHKDMRERLPQLDPAQARRVDAVLRRNREERHLRGGQATREKYIRRRRRAMGGKEVDERRAGGRAAR